jgi:hypothetical protein
MPCGFHWLPCFSTDGLPFHYLANEPHTDQRIPTQFAKFGELRRLLKVVRNHDRVWQTTPSIESKPMAIAYVALTSGRLFGKPPKTSALAAVEQAVAPCAARGLAGEESLPAARRRYP